MALKAVQYVGPFAEVEVETALGAWLVCAHGSTIEVAAPMAESLLEQADNWQTPAAGTPAPIDED